MQTYKKEKLTNLLLIILISAFVSFLVVCAVNKNNTVTQTQTQNVNINTKEDKEKIDINKATKEELMLLPQVGDKTADKIISNRPYKSIYELINIDGIGEQTLKEIEGRVKCE